MQLILTFRSFNCSHWAIISDQFWVSNHAKLILHLPPFILFAVNHIRLGLTSFWGNSVVIACFYSWLRFQRRWNPYVKLNYVGLRISSLCFKMYRPIMLLGSVRCWKPLDLHVGIWHSILGSSHSMKNEILVIQTVKLAC